MSERICSRCGNLAIEECSVCLDEFNNRKNANLMTPEERIEEFDSWKKCEIYFDKIHKRIEELVGRPVFTHELGLMGWEGIKEEIKTGKSSDLEEILNLIPSKKLIIIKE